MTRLLVVDAPHFYAGAVWQRVNDAWQCIEAAPILKWMRGKSAAQTGDYLKRKGWAYQWVTA
jgi:hypothetical protein